MSSIIISSLAVIFLLCFIHMSTSSSASRVIVNQELPHKQNATFQNNPMNVERVKEEEKTTVRISASSSEENAMKKERKKKPKKQDQQGQKSEHVINRNGRQSHHRAAKRSSYSKNLSSAKHPKVVSWRVPKMQNELPQTGFNLDYAPPKVHPPTHN